MRRDFSERARQELLSLVRQVEQEKLCDFTDWVGDKWLDFQGWIGALDINRYLQNINDYHRKVIDRNNSTEASINAIFLRVNQVDGGHRTVLDGIETDLSGWKDKIDRLSGYIQPGKGDFGGLLTDASLQQFRWSLEMENRQLLREQLYQVVNDTIVLNAPIIEDCLKNYPAAMTDEDIHALRELASVLAENVAVGKTVVCEDASKLLEIISGVIENINTRTGDHSGVGLGSELLGYFAALFGVIDCKGKPASDVVSNYLSLFEKSSGAWIALEKLLVETTYPVTDALKLHERFGNVTVGVGAAKYIAAFIRGGINGYHVFVDENSSGYDKTAMGMELFGDGLVMGGSIARAALESQKGIQWVTADGKILNQILAVDQKVTVSNAVSSKITNIMSWVAIGDVVLNTGAGGLRRYEEVMEDGEFDMGDAGSIGVHGAMNGLDTTVNHLTLGLVDIDGEGFADELEESVDEFVKSDHWAAEVLRDQDTNIVIRGGVALGASVNILVSETVESVGEGFEAVGNWFSSKWNDWFG